MRFLRPAGSTLVPRRWWALPVVVLLLLGVGQVARDTPASVRPAQADSRTPVAPASPPSVGSLVRDLSEAVLWTPENGGSLEELAEEGPGGEPVLRSTLTDGQTGASAGSIAGERNDLRGGDVPLGSVRWMTWSERFVEVPTTDIDSWQLIGPNEIHGVTLNQATVMPQVGADGRRRLNVNAGRAEARNFDLGPIVPGEWHDYRFGIHYTQGDDGWVELWKDGVRVVRVEGPTTTENYGGYWKFAHYRNAAIDGSSVYDVSGVRVYE